jgi:hypothetical protein
VLEFLTLLNMLNKIGKHKRIVHTDKHTTYNL